LFLITFFSYFMYITDEIGFLSIYNYFFAS
jgi:hypothetical protein